MSEQRKLTDLEDRLLSFHAWAATGKRKYLCRALGATDDEFAGAENRLLELGLIAPTKAVSRQ